MATAPSPFHATTVLSPREGSGEPDRTRSVTSDRERAPMSIGSSNESDGSEENDSAEIPDPLNALREKITMSLENSKFDKTLMRRFLPRDIFDALFKDLPIRGPGLESFTILQLLIWPHHHEGASKDDIKLAEYISNRAKTVFLVVICSGLEDRLGAMRLFHENEFDDECLPYEVWCNNQLRDEIETHEFVRWEGRKNKRSKRIWTCLFINRFQNEQWQFLAPIISTSTVNRNCNFTQRPLPFIEKGHTPRSGASGAHGVVSRYEVHPAHFEDGSSSVSALYSSETFLQVTKLSREISKPKLLRLKRSDRAVKRSILIGKGRSTQSLG